MSRNDEGRLHTGPATITTNPLAPSVIDEVAEDWVLVERYLIDEARAVRRAWWATLGLTPFDDEEARVTAFAFAEVDRAIRRAAA